MDVYQRFKGIVGIYSNETYLLPGLPQLDMLKRKTKRVPVEPKSKKKILLRKVEPYPDPERVEQTTWLAKERIEEESWKPSTKWVEAGSGQLGQLFVEIIQCDGLPNMDLIRTTNVLDITHAFVCLVHEDCVVHTDVIADSRSPRWMPWSQRAFSFRMSHPQSDLYLGVFSFHMEKSPVQMTLSMIKAQHDPIGRCTVNLSGFSPLTEYILTYPIYYGGLGEGHN